jgi:CheY-like chemotaxis protein
MFASGTHPRATRHGRVLVVDDEPFVAHALQIFLGDEHDVRVVTTAREALALLDRGARYDGILCDVLMPDMNGVELHRALVARYPDQAERMVFITGGVVDRVSCDYLASIPNPCIDKPPDPFALRAMMRARVSAAMLDEEERAASSGG